MSRLKGRNVKRLKKEQKKRMQRTLDKMQKVRQMDSDNLREVIKQKAVWAQNEKAKGLKQMGELKTKIERLNGILLFIADLLKSPEKREEK